MKSAYNVYNVYFTLYSNYKNIVYLLRGRRPWDFEMAEILPIRRKTTNSQPISTYRAPGAEIPGIGMVRSQYGLNKLERGIKTNFGIIVAPRK